MTGKEENGTGRPSKLSDAIVEKLELGFARGYNVTEACKFAGIDRGTYYNWLEANEEFFNRMEMAKCDLNIKAKNNIADEIDRGNIELSKWHLERRAKDEYSTKQSIDADVNTDVKIVVELVDE